MDGVVKGGRSGPGVVSLQAELNIELYIPATRPVKRTDTCLSVLSIVLLSLARNP